MDKAVRDTSAEFGRIDILINCAGGIFPFKDADPAIAETLSKDQQYFRGEQGIDGMAAEPTPVFGKRM